MRNYERNGVTIDQCSGCRGIFLDRGELEQLIDAEAGYYGGQQTPPAPFVQPGWQNQGNYGGKHGGHNTGHGRGGHNQNGRRRRGGFLGDLFD
ncbi:hypothetical protein UM93_11335 [Psychromicrobium lacuslunae]|uniref:Transcription factor zinc-finger domain-containing protein n=2 Tax=Psychromicrobium lacuslunae TaxID=1618207 RepID=A0A0D4BZT2_9MICC|nr:hypothetical protein UM93_11335 [Psychromicrobium lacuslunae]